MKKQFFLWKADTGWLFDKEEDLGIKKKRETQEKRREPADGGLFYYYAIQNFYFVYNVNDMDTRKGLVTNIIFFAVLLCLMALCLGVGKYSLNIFGEMSDMDINMLLGVRLPRVLAAVFVGAALSLAGAVYQGVFKNPLVSPEFLGISTGACVGAAVAILMSFSAIFIQAFAFLGGISAVTLTLLIPKALKSSSNIMLVLAGIIVGGAMSSVLGFIKYIADPETQLASITYWQMGSFAYVDMNSLLYVLPFAVAAAFLILAMSWWVDILSLGENEAQMLGVSVGVMRGVFIVCATVLTASAVCIAGTIGWVGLVIPHLCRMIVGPANRVLLPSACFLGGIFLLTVDTATRLIGPAEMPISILTGIIGAPFYAWLLYRQRSRLR